LQSTRREGIDWETMLRSAGTLTATLTVLAIAGCGLEQDYLADSRAKWRKLADGSGDTYSYSVSTSSWSGYRTLTALQFESGAGTYRRFESNGVSFQQGSTAPLVVEWEERGADVGSHPTGAAVATVDQLYDRCALDVLSRDRNQNTITLDFDDRGILRACTYRPLNCADDCTMGVGIEDLVMGKTY
jgi:hypothetical protein